MIDLVEKERSADERFVAELTELVNEVYAAGEKGIWIEGTDRTGPAEIAAMIEAGHLVVARDGDAVIGAMRLQRLPTGEGEFGMLVAHPAHRGAGIGRELIAYAEDWARSQGLRTMQLELLFPRGWTHPVKQFLHDWYQRLGYRVVRHGDLGEDYPDLIPRLATECDFLVFHKAL